MVHYFVKMLYNILKSIWQVNWLLTEKRMQKALDTVIEEIKIPTSVIDITGTVVASSEKELIGQMKPFIKKLAKKTEIRGFTHDGKTYARFFVDNKIPYYLTMDGVTETIRNYSLLTASLLEVYIKSSKQKISKEEVVRRFIYDQIDEVELKDYCMEYNINTDAPRCAFIIQTMDTSVKDTFGILVDTFPKDDGDMWIAVDSRNILFAKIVSEDLDDYGLNELANAMEETILNELSIKAYIGVGRSKEDLFGIRDSYNEAQKAIEIGRIYAPNSRTYMYNELLLERFLHEIPAEIYEKFYDDTFYEEFDKVFNDEMILTIEKFFENSLNLSETSRQLYIHRNTLVYRLDKIEKVMGLDLRNFHDAVTFKIMMMMDRHVRECSN